MEANLDEKYYNLSKKYLTILKEIENTSESNISLHVIEPILIEELNFNKQWIKKEERSENSSKHFDITIDDGSGNKIIVECKKANKKLNNEHLEQITGYLNSKNVEWGILTNGYEWMLVNNKLQNVVRISDKVVFHVNLDMKRKALSPTNLKFYIYNSIFINGGIINYFKLIHQFKLYKGYQGNSWSQYKSALTMLSRYLMEQYNNHYVDMDRIQSPQIIEFYRWYANQETHKTKNKNVVKGTLSEATVKSLYRYINSFYNELLSRDLFKINPFKNMKPKEIITKVEDIIELNNNKQNASAEVIERDCKSVFCLLDTKRDSERNKFIFSLFLYGLGREEIVSLKTNQYDGKNLILISKGVRRRIPLSAYIKELLDIYLTQRKEKKLASNLLICSSTGKKLRGDTISMFMNDCLKEVDSSLTIEKIQKYIYKELILNGKDIFSILYVTNLDVATIRKFISPEDIERFGNPDKLLKRHPLKFLI